jgi:ABC-type uncharacterized transport system permease subunit
MLGKITITCFAASYLVALLLELSRLLFRSGIRGAVMLGFAAAGFVAHTMFLGYRWFTEREWLNSEFDWYLLAAWVLAAVYLYLVAYHRQNPIGLFILPVVLMLVLVAQFWASRTPFPKTSGLNGYVAAAHGTFQLLGTVAAAIGFMSGAMYLIQAWRLKHKKIAPKQGLRLPTLEWLQRTTSKAISTSGVMLIGGFLSGALLSRIKYGEVRWSDPVVWSSSVLAAWMVTAGAFNLFYKPARQGRKVAYLTLATFVMVALTLAAMLMDPHHGGKQANPDEESEQPQAVQAGGAA